MPVKITSEHLKHFRESSLDREKITLRYCKNNIGEMYQRKVKSEV
jgi:hypothetical protein